MKLQLVFTVLIVLIGSTVTELLAVPVSARGETPPPSGLGTKACECIELEAKLWKEYNERIAIARHAKSDREGRKLLNALWYWIDSEIERRKSIYGEVFSSECDKYGVRLRSPWDTKSVREGAKKACPEAMRKWCKVWDSPDPSIISKCDYSDFDHFGEDFLE